MICTTLFRWYPWCQCIWTGSVRWSTFTDTHARTHVRTYAHTQNDTAAQLMSHPPLSHSVTLLCLSPPSLPPSHSLSLSLCSGDITQKGYEKKRGKLLAPYIPQIQGKTSVGRSCAKLLPQSACLWRALCCCV